MKSSVRAGDTVARYGGEEFVVICLNTELKESVSIAERILETLAELKIEHEASSASQYLTVSDGLATGVINSQEEAENLISRADKNLYLAKQQGRNQFVVNQY